MLSTSETSTSMSTSTADSGTTSIVSYYEHLPSQERATFTGLQQAAQNKDVTGFIAQVGYGAIFGLLEHLDNAHSYQVNRLIEAALTAEAGHPVKRQDHHHSNFYNYLQNINSQYYESLPEPERHTYHALVNAAQAHNLTDYIHTVGYGPLFGFLEHMDYVHANQVYDYLAAALNYEAEHMNTQ